MGHFVRMFMNQFFLCEYIFVCFQSELLNETDKKESPEIDEARNTIVEGEKVFETIEA